MKFYVESNKLETEYKAVQNGDLPVLEFKLPVKSAIMEIFILLLAIVQSLHGFCWWWNDCDTYWDKNKNNRTVTEACAVLFDESCCKASKINMTIGTGANGHFGKSEKHTWSLIVMPECRLEFWNHETGLEEAEYEERKGFNQGNIKDPVHGKG